MKENIRSIIGDLGNKPFNIHTGSKETNIFSVKESHLCGGLVCVSICILFSSIYYSKVTFYLQIALFMFIALIICLFSKVKNKYN